MVKDLTGLKFGKLTVLKLEKTKQKFKENGLKAGKLYYWLCKCECGKLSIVEHYKLINKTRSCGCLKIESLIKRSTKHGCKHKKIYPVWQGIKDRCFNKNNKRYNCYGGRGISVCDEWLDFQTFYNWAQANGYKEGLTIDRIDVNRNYEPSNCRWVTTEIQNKNTRQNHKVTYNGVTKCVCEWAEDIGINEATLRYRLKAWGIEKALNTPKQW